MVKNKQEGKNNNPSGKYGGYKGKWQKDRELKKTHIVDKKPTNNSAKPSQHIKFDGDSETKPQHNKPAKHIPSKDNNKTNAYPSKSFSKPNSFNKGKILTQNTLYKEIFSLGGNKEDFDFLQGVDEDNIDPDDEGWEDEEADTKKELAVKNKNSSEGNLASLVASMIGELGLKDFALSDDEEIEEDSNKQSDKLKAKNTKNDKLSQEVANLLKNPSKFDDDGNEEISNEINASNTKGNDDGNEIPSSVVVNQEETRESNFDATFNPSEKLFRPLKKALFDSNPLWYELPLDPVEEGPKFSDIVLGQLKTQAKKLIDEDIAIRKKKEAGTQDNSFYDSILTKGTLVDKISAITLRIQESPFHHMEELESLVGMVKRKNKREAGLAVASFKDLCINGLLPDDRKLKFFQDQPLSGSNVTKTHLALWYFEDLLKRSYFEFLLAAEALSHDQVSHTKLSMVTLFSELLKSKPEQEQNLLSLLVNKLGDPENKVASKCSYLLLQLLEAHPSMKPVVALEINQLLSRPKISLRTKAYAINTLNQFVLTSGEKDLANYLIELYFSTFNHLLTVSSQPADKKKRLRKDRKKGKHKKNKAPPALPIADEEAEISKVIAGILTGVNRTFPFAQLDPTTLQSHVDTLFKITHTYNLNTVIQSLSLIYQISGVKKDISDRYYRVLYQFLLDFRLIHTSKQAMYVNLLFKSLKRDDKPKRVLSFVKRLIQICQWHQPPFICGILYLIHKITQTHPIISEFMKYTSDQTKEIREKMEAKGEEVGDYDGLKLDPQYAHAETSLPLEVTSLVNHFHPTVAVFANKLLEGEIIEDNSHLHLHSLMHFLDRFVFRKPKQSTESGSIHAKGSSIMQPIINPYQKQDMLSVDRAVTWTKGAHPGVPVNSTEFLEQDPNQIAADQQFFYKYFSLVNKAKPMLSTKSKKADSDDEDFLGSDIDEDEAWDAIRGTNPDGDGEEDNFDDEDIDMDDYFDDEDLDMDQDDEIDDGDDDDEAESALKNTAKAISFDDLANEDEEDEDDDIEEDQLDVEDDEELDSDELENVEDENENEDEDEEDGIDSDDEDLPFDLSSDDEATPSKGSKRKQPPTKSQNKSKKAKNKFKDLPVFASAEDYSHMLD